MSDFESADESGNEGGHDSKESSNAFAEVLANLGLAPAAAEKKGHRRARERRERQGGRDRAGSLPGTATRHRHRRAQSSFGGKGDKAGESVLWNMFASITSGYEKARSKTRRERGRTPRRGGRARGVRLAAQGAIDGVARTRRVRFERAACVEAPARRFGVGPRR